MKVLFPAVVMMWINANLQQNTTGNSTKQDPKCRGRALQPRGQIFTSLHLEIDYSCIHSQHKDAWQVLI